MEEASSREPVPIQRGEPLGSDGTGLEESVAEFPSVDDVKPSEEGGPTARIGFSYQHEVTVGLALDMLADPNIIKLHCETHDDVVVVSMVDNPAGGRSLVVRTCSSTPISFTHHLDHVG